MLVNLRLQNNLKYQLYCAIQLFELSVIELHVQNCHNSVVIL